MGSFFGCGCGCGCWHQKFWLLYVDIGDEKFQSWQQTLKLVAEGLLL